MCEILCAFYLSKCLYRLRISHDTFFNAPQVILRKMLGRLVRLLLCSMVPDSVNTASIAQYTTVNSGWNILDEIRDPRGSTAMAESNMGNLQESASNCFAEANLCIQLNGCKRVKFMKGQRHVTLTSRRYKKTNEIGSYRHN